MAVETKEVDKDKVGKPATASVGTDESSFAFKRGAAISEGGKQVNLEEEEIQDLAKKLERKPEQQPTAKEEKKEAPTPAKK